MDLGISGKTAVITGGSAGIGKAIAEEFARASVRLVLVARGTERLSIAAREITKSQGTEVLTVAADVADPAAPDRIMAAAVERFGSVDILVNNAGRAHSGGILAASEDDWQAMTETKVSALRRLCRAAIPYMRERHWGRIVNISSIGGLYPNPKLMVSHALSALINNLTRSLAIELAPDGILVNAIGVGAVVTDNWKINMLPAVRRRRPEIAHYSDEALMKLLAEEMIPVGRFGRPEEIAAIVAFLASARNGYVTGDTIEASGGAERFI